MRDEKKEQWMQRIMAVICLFIMVFFVYTAIKDNQNKPMTEEDKRIERALDGENSSAETAVPSPTETAANE